DRAQHGAEPGSHRVRRDRRGRIGLDTRGVRRVDADRRRADLRRGARLLAHGPLPRAGLERGRRLGAARDLRGEDRAGRAHPALPAPRAGADRAPTRAPGDARDMKAKPIPPSYWIASVVVLAVLPWVPGLQNDFARSLLSQMGIAAIFALSYN